MSYVYTFAYPDGTVFYVGKGSGDRIKSHLYEAVGKCTSVSRAVTVIRSIWRQGEKVIIRKPYNNISDVEALQREKELIALYGYEQLVNQPFVTAKDRKAKKMNDAVSRGESAVGEIAKCP